MENKIEIGSRIRVCDPEEPSSAFEGVLVHIDREDTYYPRYWIKPDNIKKHETYYGLLNGGHPIYFTKLAGPQIRNDIFIKIQLTIACYVPYKELPNEIRKVTEIYGYKTVDDDKTTFTISKDKNTFSCNTETIKGICYKDELTDIMYMFSHCPSIDILGIVVLRQ